MSELFSSPRRRTMSMHTSRCALAAHKSVPHKALANMPCSIRKAQSPASEARPVSQAGHRGAWDRCG
eukprot:2183937-Alexandrium_andersonii.AAC.1